MLTYNIHNEVSIMHAEQTHPAKKESAYKLRYQITYKLRAANKLRYPWGRGRSFLLGVTTMKQGKRGWFRVV